MKRRSVDRVEAATEPVADELAEKIPRGRSPTVAEHLHGPDFHRDATGSDGLSRSAPRKRSKSRHGAKRHKTDRREGIQVISERAILRAWEPTVETRTLAVEPQASISSMRPSAVAPTPAPPTTVPLQPRFERRLRRGTVADSTTRGTTSTTKLVHHSYREPAPRRSNNDLQNMHDGVLIVSVMKCCEQRILRIREQI